MKPILYLNHNINTTEDWKASAVLISELDPHWPERSVIGKVVQLLQLGNRFDVILLYYDYKFAALVAVVSLLGRNIGLMKAGIWFQEFMVDVTEISAGRSARNRVRYWLLKVLLRGCQGIIVHTQKECEIYSSFFRVAQAKFVFVPYHAYFDVASTHVSKGDVFVVAGRRRDYKTAIEACDKAGVSLVIVASTQDRDSIEGYLKNKKVEVMYDIPSQAYHEIVGQAKALILPFLASRRLRALGHITAFSAIVQGVPVIASEGFQLADYFSGEEVCFVKPEDPEELGLAIQYMLRNPDVATRLSQEALKKVKERFTIERTTQQLIKILLNGPTL